MSIALVSKEEPEEYSVPSGDGDNQTAHTDDPDPMYHANIGGSFPVKVEYTDETLVNSESVEDLLARAESIVLENQALIDQARSSNGIRFEPIDQNMSVLSNQEQEMAEMLQNTMAQADHVIQMAQSFLDESSAETDNSILEIIDLQRPTPHEISDNDDDDDVIFVNQVDAPPVIPVVVDLSQDSPVAVRPSTPYDEIQDMQVVDFVLDHTFQPSTSSSRRRPREFNPIVQLMAQQIEESATASAALAAATLAAVHANAEAEAARFAALERSPKRTRVDSANNKQINCAVCLEPPFDNRPTATVCGHVFCHACIMMAIKQCKKCPMCNRRLSAKQVHMLYI